MPRSLSHGARLHCVKCYTNTDVKCQISGNTNDKSKKTTHFSLRHYCNYFKRLASVMIRAIPNSQLWKTCHGPRNQTSPVKSSYWRQGAGGRTAGSSQARGSCQASGSSIKQEQDMLFPCTAAWGRQGAGKWDPPLGTYPSCRKLQDWAAVESWWRWGWSPLCCWEHSSQGLLAASSGQVGEARSDPSPPLGTSCSCRKLWGCCLQSPEVRVAIPWPPYNSFATSPQSLLWIRAPTPLQHHEISNVNLWKHGID